MRWLAVMLVMACGGPPAPPPSAVAPAGAQLADLVAKARELQSRHVLEPVIVGAKPSTSDPEIIATLRKAVCTNRASYATCVPLPGDAALVARAWMMLGDEHLIEGQNTDAVAAFERAATAGAPELVETAHYKAAWATFRADKLDDAVGRFDRIVRDAKPSELRKEALVYLALSFVERNPDKPDAGLDAAFAYYRARRDPYLFEVFTAVGDALADAMQTAHAIRAYDHALATWPGAANRAATEAKVTELRRRNP